MKCNIIIFILYIYIYRIILWFRPSSYHHNQTTNVIVKSPTIPNIILTGKENHDNLSDIVNRKSYFIRISNVLIKKNDFHL
jgi:hypothetical protein